MSYPTVCTCGNANAATETFNVSEAETFCCVAVQVTVLFPPLFHCIVTVAFVELPIIVAPDVVHC